MSDNASNKVMLDKNELKIVLSYIDFFTDIDEDDYIVYNEEHDFSYTTEMYDFIEKLSKAGLVEDYQHMISEITINNPGEQEKCEAFSGWMKEMNKTLSRPCEMRNADIHFIRRAFLTLIRLEKIFPGSWAIDVETGTWLRLLRRLKELYEAGEIELE